MRFRKLAAVSAASIALALGGAAASSASTHTGHHTAAAANAAGRHGRWIIGNAYDFRHINSGVYVTGESSAIVQDFLFNTKQCPSGDGQDCNKWIAHAHKVVNGTDYEQWALADSAGPACLQADHTAGTVISGNACNANADSQWWAELPTGDGSTYLLQDLQDNNLIWAPNGNSGTGLELNFASGFKFYIEAW